jgi:hypothetical protein
MQTPIHWNLIGRSMTAQQFVLSPISILLPPSSQALSFPLEKKLSARFRTIVIFIIIIIIIIIIIVTFVSFRAWSHIEGGT